MCTFCAQMSWKDCLLKREHWNRLGWRREKWGKGGIWLNVHRFQDTESVPCVQFIQDCLYIVESSKSLFETSSPARCLEVPDVC